ncbi:peptidylprolyl isomerase [Pseudothauera nasutitermitis]|uniref:Periplasmic chaperone PpiD n=1 Tax=Pseudothauera nasutitermitis TaxID=2565930 RepID=A0A4S4B423_9RHOO|nr:SurA N-terminal domain-containing protein [Pseudothauera nasutitermitis]THF67448.1 peptidylprolyl isomerase [Pseudothauera nasutitermitis]
MFEAVRKNKRFAQIILALLIVPFAFFGMDAYFADGPAGNEVAVVGDSKIYAFEFDEALRTQQDRLRESMGAQFDRSLLDSPELRRAVLDNLINQRLLALHAAEHRLVVTPQQLQSTIFEVPAFQDNGQFSMQRYEAVLRGQGMNPATFESRLSQDLRVQQMAMAVSDASFVATESARRFLLSQGEEREVREMAFPAAEYLDHAKVGEEAVRAFYDANPERFEQPARVKAEYLAFDESALLSQLEVSEDDIRQAYESSAERYGVPEERRARHILLELGPDASEQQLAETHARAEQLTEQVRKEPGRFEALARENSVDTGSASRGGDLGFFGRGVMVKPFEDAVFGAAKDEVLDPVRSDFGYHIIQVTDIRAPQQRPLAEVRGEIEEELKRQRAGQRYAELAEQFANTVYEQADSLAPAAELLGLQVQQTDWIARNSAAVGPYNSERLVEALFSDESVNARRNVDAVEVAPSVLVAARVIDHQAARRLPFEEVRAGIEGELREAEAERLAREDGEAVLAALERGEQPVREWGPSATLQRATASLTQDALHAVFGAPSTNLPAHVGVTVPGSGYALYRIETVTRPELAEDDPRVGMIGGQYAQLLAERDFAAFLSLLRERYKVEVRESTLRAAQQQ